MDGIDTAQLVYLVLLGTLIAGYFFAENRIGMGRTLRYAMVWVFIFLGAIVAVGLWEDVRRTVLPRQAVLEDGVLEVPRGPDGHFHLQAKINGVPVDFLVDTGATDIVLSREDAARVGLPRDLPFLGRADTANGTVEIAFARVDEMTVGPVTRRDVPVSINGGRLFKSLLGMAWLNQYGRLEFTGDRLRLEP